MKNKYNQEIKNVNFKLSTGDNCHFEKLKAVAKHRQKSMNELLREWIDRDFKKLNIKKRMGI